MKIICLSITIIMLTSIQFLNAESNYPHQVNNVENAQLSNEDLNEFEHLLMILDKYTEVATKSKLNSEYVPGIVSVVTRQEMESRGYRTVKDVLSAVPGIEISIDAVGYRQINVRGVGASLASGNVKFLINNISGNDNVASNADMIMDMPVEQLERIEIIRGPGSAIHGEFAFTGVVNVITRDQGKNVFFDIGSNNTFTGGCHISEGAPDDDFQMSMSLSASKTDGPDNVTGKDILYGMGFGDISYAPGKTNEKRNYLSGLLSLAYKNFSLSGHYISANMGSHFNSSYALMPDNEKTVFHKNAIIIESKLLFELSSDLHIEMKNGFSDFRYKDKEVLVYPPGFAFSYPDGMRATYFTQERRFNIAFDFKYSGFDKHTILLGCSYDDIELADSWAELNFNPISYAPLESIRRFDDEKHNGFPVGQKRRLRSITFQDEFHVTDGFSFTGGLRFDDYSDAGSTYSPRLAGVYRISSNHILKTQYSSAFRPPSFMEMYLRNTPGLAGNPDIKPSTIDTYEVCYIYKAQSSLGKVSMFYSDLNKIIVNENGIYQNSGESFVYGNEFELTQPLGNMLKLDTNLTLLKTEDRQTNREIPGAANILANAILIFTPCRNVSFSILYRHVGERSRAVFDERDDLSAYNTVDFSASIYHLWHQGIKLRVGISNLFDTSIRYPSPLSEDFSGNLIQTYPDDFPGAERQFWFNITCSF